MELLLSQLSTIPEYRALLDAARLNQTSGISGIGQINRSHIIAGLYRDLDRPLMVICHDDATAKRLSEDLKSFLPVTPPCLPSRELTLYDTAVVSRGWEQKRLRQLFDLSQGNTKLQIFTWDSLSLRTIPKDILTKAAFSLKVKVGQK